MSPAEFRARLTRWASGAMPGLLEDMAKLASVRIGARAVGTYMRNAKGEGRRRAGDAGPLRIATGDYARSVRGGGRGSIERIAMTGLRAKLEKGVRLAEQPKGYNETGVLNGFGRGIRIPARPTLRPALNDEADNIRSLAQRRFLSSVRKAVRTGGVA